MAEADRITRPDRIARSGAPDRIAGQGMAEGRVGGERLVRGEAGLPASEHAGHGVLGSLPPTGTAEADRAAFFDFDATLTRRDTLFPWLILLRGRRRVYRAAAQALAGQAMGRVTGAEDMRGRVKAAFLRRLIAGIPVEEARAAALDLGRSIAWKSHIVAELHEHRRAGHRVVVASGSPMIVVHTIVSDRFGVDEVMATDLEVVGGRLTGRLEGRNCIRNEKAARVADWLQAHGPFVQTFGYGNLPHDRPMLDLLDHGTIVP